MTTIGIHHLFGIGLVCGIVVGPICAYPLWWVEREVFAEKAGNFLWALGWMVGIGLGWFFFGRLVFRKWFVWLLLPGFLAGQITAFFLLLIWSEVGVPPVSINLFVSGLVGMFIGGLSYFVCEVRWWFYGDKGRSPRRKVATEMQDEE